MAEINNFILDGSNEEASKRLKELIKELDEQNEE